MRRGTTPTHVFTLPVDVGEISDVRIIYSQGSVVTLKKGMSDCTIEGNKITVKLTREDTWLFDSIKLVSIQIEVWLSDGDCMVSDVIIRPVDDCLDDEV